MDTDDLTSLVPHYVVMVVLAMVALTVATAAVGELGFWLELAVVVVVIFAYRPIVTKLGYAPEVWKRD